MADLPLACPAATAVNLRSGPGVRCGVLAVSNEGAEVGGFTERGDVDDTFEGHTVTARRYCADDGTTDRRTGYERCEIWKAEQARLAAGRKGPDALIDEQAERVDAAPDQRIGGALDALAGGTLGSDAAVERALQSGGVILGA